MTTSSALHALAERCGVAVRFTGFGGVEQTVSDDTLVAVLAAMDVDAADDAAAQRSLAALDDEPWRRLVPPVVVVTDGDRAVIPVHVPHGDPVEVWIRTEDGEELDATQLDVWVEPRSVDGRLTGRATFALPEPGPGWHTVHARHNDLVVSADYVVTPARLHTADRLLARRRWGIAAQLYSVRSASSWGTGDLADLGDLATIAADAGADFLLTNPVHAAEPVPPVEPSPYLPTSRRFLSPLYIRVEDVREAAYLSRTDLNDLARAGRRHRRRNDDATTLRRNGPLRAKLALLERIHRVPRSAAREAAFTCFRADRGRPLEDFALWCALYETLGPDSEHWEGKAATPDEPWVERRRVRLADRIDFHCWLQWICDEQAAAAHRDALAAGMDIGVVADLAVGVAPDGADAWTLPEALARGVTVGAPPDDFNRSGQDWNQPPWRPDRLAEQGFRPFRDVVRAALRHSGGLRVDHVLGLFRSWWIPEGAPADQGTYVRNDHEALVGILALEASRADAVVVGEDLGVFEGWVQEYLTRRGIAGTSVLWFERDGETPRPVDSYRALCLTSVTTHDLPPTAGYLDGEHIRVRSELGLLAGSFEDELAADAHERDAFLALAHARDRADASGPDVPESPDLAGTEPAGAHGHLADVLSLHRLVASSPSAAIAVSLADAVGERRSQNQPGTVDEYPNWRVPLADANGRAVAIEDLSTNPTWRAITRAVDDIVHPQD